MLQELKTLTNYRELLWIWTLRDIKVRYKQSILGGLWAILQPLAPMIIFSVIFVYILKVPTEDIPYPIFSYTALLPWTFLATSISFAIPSLLNNSHLLTKIYFPREIFPLSAIGGSFLDFLIASVVFMGMMLFYQVPFKITLVAIPLLLLIQILLTLGITMFGSAVIVFYRDIRFVVPLVIQLWFYATPIIYPISLVKENLGNLYWLYLLNPMAIIIEAYRDVTLRGIWPNWGGLGIAAAISLIIFLFGYLYFKRVEWQFADII